MNTEDTNEISERDDRGRFLKGKKAGPGRNSGNRWLTELREELGSDDWRKVVRSLIDQANNGSVKAAALLARYAIPNPAILDRKLTGELQEQLMQLKTFLAEGNCDPKTAAVLARIVALESVLARAGTDGKILSLADVNNILNSEVDL